MAIEGESSILNEIDKMMDNFIDEVFAISQENLVREGKVDTGLMLKTANINRNFLEKEIVYPTPYAEFVEFGRAPGTMPPTLALNKWVIRKLGVKPKQANSVAFAVAKAIKQRGIEQTPFLRNAIDQTKLAKGF